MITQLLYKSWMANYNEQLYNIVFAEEYKEFKSGSGQSMKSINYR